MFLAKNNCKLKNDPEFLLSSLVRGEITYKFFRKYYLKDDILDQMSDIQLDYMNDILKLEYEENVTEYDENDVRFVCSTSI